MWYSYLSSIKIPATTWGVCLRYISIIVGWIKINTWVRHFSKDYTELRHGSNYNLEFIGKSLCSAADILCPYNDDVDTVLRLLVTFITIVFSNITGLRSTITKQRLKILNEFYSLKEVWEHWGSCRCLLQHYATLAPLAPFPVHQHHLVNKKFN